MTIFTGDDGILDDIFSYQTYNHLKNHWRDNVRPGDIQNGMIWSDTTDGKLRHCHGGADEEILQLNRSSDVTPSFANLKLAEYLYHTGDLDTYVRFQTNQITLRAGGVDFINIIEAGTDYLALFGGKVFIGDNANANMVQGLTIQQGANDDEIFALKSSDVAHGYIANAETDTFCHIAKRDADYGGVQFTALSEDDIANTIGLRLSSYGGRASTTKTTAGRGLIELYASQISGNAPANIAADGNVVSMRFRRGGGDITGWILDEDGDTWQDGMVTANGFTSGAPTELTIAGGVITITKDYHRVDGQGDAVDDLVTINGGIDGMKLFLQIENPARAITVKETGNIQLVGGDFVMDTIADKLMLLYDAISAKWCQIAQANNV